MIESDYPQPGDRVCAFPIRLDTHADNAHVYIYGCGVYEEDGVPPVSFSVSDENDETSIEDTFLIPRIRLDEDRGVTWGSECFFTFETAVLEGAEGREIVLLDIKAERERWARENFSSN